MTSFVKLKEKCDNYLDTRVYNYTKAKKRQKAILRDKKKFQNFKFHLNIINGFEKCIYIDIILGNNVKESFNELHYVKMLKNYKYLKFYHENIKKFNYNERLLCYLEEVIKKNYYYLLNIKVCSGYNEEVNFLI